MKTNNAIVNRCHNIVLDGSQTRYFFIRPEVGNRYFGNSVAIAAVIC